MHRIIGSADGTRRLDFDEGYSSVIILTKDDKTAVCLSSQIGCPVGCRFCHAGPFIRNLSCQEIVGQFEECRNTCGVIRSVVFMGMGEPMLNFGNVSEAIEIIHSRFALPYQRITLSTCGINLERLRGVRFQVAVSLHSADDYHRRWLVPLGACVSEIVMFAQEYGKGRKNGLMIEYAMIKGLNDTDDDLASLLSLPWPKNTNFNLLEFNEADGLERSDRMNYFKVRIMAAGFKCFIRQSRGADISASCGMLDTSYTTSL